MIKDGLKPYRILWDPSFLRWVHDECFQEFHDVLWFDRDRETTTHLHQRWSLAATKIATEAFERGMDWLLLLALVVCSMWREGRPILGLADSQNVQP